MYHSANHAQLPLKVSFPLYCLTNDGLSSPFPLFHLVFLKRRPRPPPAVNRQSNGGHFLIRLELNRSHSVSMLPPYMVRFSPVFCSSPESFWENRTLVQTCLFCGEAGTVKSVYQMLFPYETHKHSFPFSFIPAILPQKHSGFKYTEIFKIHSPS